MLTHPSSLVVDHLSSQLSTKPRLVPVVYLYSDYRDQSNLTLVNILGTLLHQILTSPGFAYSLVEVRKPLERIKNQGGKMQVPALTAMLKLVLQHLDCLYICLDALDELAEGARRDLLKFLRTELNYNQIYIFLTARSHMQQEIIGYLKVDANRVISITASPDDIREFVSNRIKEDMEFNPDEMTADLESEILTSIVNRSQGMYETSPILLSYEFFLLGHTRAFL